MAKRKVEKEILERLRAFIGTYLDRCTVSATPSRCQKLIRTLEEFFEHFEKEEFPSVVSLFQIAQFVGLLQFKGPEAISARISNLARLGLGSRSGETDYLLDEFLVKRLHEIIVVKSDRKTFDFWQEEFISSMTNAWEELVKKFDFLSKKGV